jgi:uncharacterized membrane protein (GlpM family)
MATMSKPKVDMPFLVRVAITVVIIVIFVQVGRRLPTLGGLLATMPLTSVIVLIWLRTDCPDDPGLLTRYAQGAFWGIIPSLVFFGVTYLCFRREMTFPAVLTVGFAAWLVGAAVHQWFLK